MGDDSSPLVLDSIDAEKAHIELLDAKELKAFCSFISKRNDDYLTFAHEHVHRILGYLGREAKRILFRNGSLGESQFDNSTRGQ